VKGAVEGDKGKQSIIERLRNQLSQKKPPAHVIKVFSIHYLMVLTMSNRFLKTK